MNARVTRLLLTPVKGLRVSECDSVLVGEAGVTEDRRFFLVDDDGRMVNGKRFGSLQAVCAAYSHAERELELRFPDGRVVAGTVSSGRPREARFFSEQMAACEVNGPWSAALSDYVATPLTLLESAHPAGAVDRGRGGAVSLVSRASLRMLSDAAGVEEQIDARRLRMLFEIDGVAAHEEDGWLGTPLRIGDAVVTLGGHVGRCLVTKRDPETGVEDLDTLDALGSYRRDAQTTEPLACGVFGEVVSPGPVRLGDALRVA